MPRGGRRPGAGRPKGSKEAQTISKEQAREAVRTLVLEKMRELVDAQVANAQGLKYLVGRHRTSGKFARLTREQVEAALAGEETEYVALEVWEKDPSVQAFTDLMNRALDKPKEQEQELKITGSLEVVQGRLIAARKRLASR